jgi:hypothetical protein
LTLNKRQSPYDPLNRTSFDDEEDEKQTYVFGSMEKIIDFGRIEFDKIDFG